MSASPNIPGVTLIDPTTGLPYAVSAGGGGTQYADGATQATPTGTVTFAKNGSTVVALQTDASGFLKVNVAAGSSGNAASAATGAAVPAQAGYTGIKVGANLVGWTGVNPSGAIQAAQVDHASVAGTTVDTNSGNKSAGTQRVVLATDQPSLTNALTVAHVGAGSATLSSVAGSATTVSILASNAARKGATVYNDSTQILYLAFAASATTSAYTVQIASQGFWEMAGPSMYTGAISGIWASANGNARITEY